MCKTVDIRKLQARARTEYGRLLDLEDDLRSVLGGMHSFTGRAQRAAREMYSLMNALNLKAVDGRDPRGRRTINRSEAEMTHD